MSDKNIHKDQLMTEDAFIRYCNSGYIGDERRLQVLSSSHNLQYRVLTQAVSWSVAA